MHREIFEHLEDVLSGAPPDLAVRHLGKCAECREKVAAMQGQAVMVRQLKPLPDAEPRPGFYARVLERIEAEGAASIWNLFAESVFAKRIAIASLSLIVLLGIYLVSAERSAEPMVSGQPMVQVCSGADCVVSGIAMVAGEDAPGAVLTRMDQAARNDDMLVNLVTYREQ